MKTTILKTLALTVCLGLTISSCKKDDATPTVSNTETADAVGDMLSTDFSGSASDAGIVADADANLAGGRVGLGGKSLATSCGVAMDTSITRASIAGAAISFTRTASLDYTLTCNGFVPTALDLTFTGSSQRTGIIVTAQGASSGTFALAGFEVGASNYTLNGTFKRTEAITQIAGIKSYTSSHELSITDVLIDKSTKAIKGGTATYTMTGVTGSGVTFSHTGTVTFLGAGAATITVNGSNYSVNLVTGTVTPA